MRFVNLSTDYPILEAWWAIHKWPAPPANLLPPNGLIIDGKAAGFLYLTDSPIAWLEWVVGNPLCDKIERGQAVDRLIRGLLQRAQELGKTMVFSSTSQRTLAGRYEESGAILGDSATAQYIWRLN